MLNDDQVLKLIGLDGKPTELTGAQLGGMSHVDLWGLRSRNQNDPDLYALLAPYEHRAYAREFVQDNPYLGPPALAVATPAYALGKYAGLVKPTTSAPMTPPSLAQVAAGFRGIGEGILKNVGIVK